MSQDNQHPNINTGEIQRGPRGNTDLDKWFSPMEEQPQLGDNVAFETKFGVMHTGVITSTSMRHMQRGRQSTGPNELLFKSESSKQPEYYAMHQVEKWQRAEPYPMRRHRSSSAVYSDCDVSVIIVLFQAYLIERYIDKFKNMHSNIGSYVRPGQVDAFLEANGKSQWTCHIGLPNSGVELVHDEDQLEIKVTVRDVDGNTNQRMFNFKQVMEYAEFVCDLCKPKI